MNSPADAFAYEHAFQDLRARCDAARGRNQVLIVDDDPVIAFTLRELIRRRCPGAAVTSITDPQAAFHAVTTGAWAVVIADVHLRSKITGGTIAEATPRTTDVCFFTGYSEDLTETAAALRVTATLRKPLSVDDEDKLVSLINERVRNCTPDPDVTGPIVSPFASAVAV
jgi:CheY-like chemotaxis protein